MMTQELKKPLSFIDLALRTGKKRQSKRTGFVHTEELIPIYENFCFALALFRQKTTESVTEGKELVEKLLAFQSPEGNFPIHLHEYPRCYDTHMALKVAPILIYLLRLFSPVLGELKGKLDHALEKALLRKPEKSFWENRYRACKGEPLLEVSPIDFSPLEWTDWIITAQLSGQNHFCIPYDSSLQLFVGKSSFDVQEGEEPRPNPIEWLLAEGQFSPRLLKDHPHQLLCAPLFPITYEQVAVKEDSFRLFWQGSSLHSIVAKTLKFNLTEPMEVGRADLFEALFHCDISPETTILVEGQKASVFHLNDWITIQTPQRSVKVKFELVLGSGDFCGHIFRSNRACQIASGYGAYDWQIGLRTLRRVSPVQINIVFFGI